jgi:WD40 repeat protein
MKTIKILPVKDPVQKLVLIDSDHLIFANSTGDILDWDLNNTEQEPQILFTNEKHQPINNLAFDKVKKWLVASSLGEIMIFPYNSQKTGNVKPEYFAIKHKAVISQIDFSPDNNLLVTGSQDAIMLWDMRDVELNQVSEIIPVVIDNSHRIFSLTFDGESKYLVYGDNKLLHVYPLNIQDVYKKLKLLMGKRVLNDQEWKYYIKGNLEKPGY